MANGDSLTLPFFGGKCNVSSLKFSLKKNPLDSGQGRMRRVLILRGFGRLLRMESELFSYNHRSTPCSAQPEDVAVHHA